MGLTDKIKDFIAPVTDEDDEISQMELSKEEAVSAGVGVYEKAKDGSMRLDSSIKIVNFEPRSYEEGETIGAHLKQKRACVINLHRLPSDERQRVVDFLCGVVFALDGTSKQVGESVILCSPRELGVSGDIDLSRSDD